MNAFHVSNVLLCSARISSTRTAAVVGTLADEWFDPKLLLLLLLLLQDGKNYGDEYLAELDYIEVVERLKEGYESDVIEDDTVFDDNKDFFEEEKGKNHVKIIHTKLVLTTSPVLVYHQLSFEWNISVE